MCSGSEQGNVAYDSNVVDVDITKRDTGRGGFNALVFRYIEVLTGRDKASK